jgi:hypothetical protein
MAHVPAIEAEVTFLLAEEGGRPQAPGPPFARYMPHLVVQAPEVREAAIVDNRPVEEYLGVCFTDGPADYRQGEPGRFWMDLMYYPASLYEDLQEAATFTVREGHRIVGYGRVLKRVPGG